MGPYVISKPNFVADILMLSDLVRNFHLVLDLAYLFFMGVPRQNFWLGQICDPRSTFYVIFNIRQ